MSPYTTTRRSFLTGALAAATGVVIGTTPAVARAVGTQDWMSGIADSTPLRRLTIPGTHNSGGALRGTLDGVPEHHRRRAARQRHPLPRHPLPDQR